MQELLEQVPAQLEKTLKTLKELQGRLDEEMNSGLAASKGAGTNVSHVAMAAKLADASTKLGREARAWSKKVVETSRQAPLEEKTEAVTRFILVQPLGARLALYRKLQDGEQNLTNPIDFSFYED